MKMKLQAANRRQKIQISTITTKSWALQQELKKFNVSKATIRKARTLQKQNGIIEMPDQVTGKKISEHVKLLVNWCTSTRNYLETKLIYLTDDEFAGSDDTEADEDEEEEIKHLRNGSVLIVLILLHKPCPFQNSSQPCLTN